MTRFIKTTLTTAALSLLVLTTSLSAQGPQSPTRAQPQGVLNFNDLKQTMENLGYQPKLFKDSETYRYLRIQTARYSIDAEVSSDGSTLWLVAYLTRLPSDAPASRLIALLRETRVGRARFGVRFKENWLSLQLSFDNKAVTGVVLRKKIDYQTKVANDTEKLWDVRKWKKSASVEQGRIQQN